MQNIYIFGVFWIFKRARNPNIKMDIYFAIFSWNLAKKIILRFFLALITSFSLILFSLHSFLASWQKKKEVYFRPPCMVFHPLFQLYHNDLLEVSRIAGFSGWIRAIQETVSFMMLDNFYNPVHGFCANPTFHTVCPVEMIAGRQWKIPKSFKL